MLLKIRHEKVWSEKFENLEMRVWWEFGQMGEIRAKRENERKEIREIRVCSNSEFLGNSV